MGCYQRIKALISDRDLKQKDLARDLGIPPSTFSNYMTGANELPLDVLVQLAEYFDVTTDFLLGRVAERRPVLMISPAEQALIRDFRELTMDQREVLLQNVRLFRAQNERC